LLSLEQLLAVIPSTDILLDRFYMASIPAAKAFLIDRFPRIDTGTLAAFVERLDHMAFLRNGQ
jgi:hypothetical protein